ATHDLEIGAARRPGGGVGETQHPGVELAADNGLDQIGARLELDQLHVQAMLLVETALVGGNRLRVVHDADIAYLEGFGGDRLGRHGQRCQRRNENAGQFHAAMSSGVNVSSSTRSVSMPSKPRISRRKSAKSDRSCDF